MARVLIVAVCLVLPSTGCMVNEYSSDTNRRIEELIKQSEDLRQIELEMERFWATDQPSHLTPERVHGGISDAPAAVQVAIANVLKEQASLYVIEETGLVFIAQVPAGEVFDFPAPPGKKLAVTFASSPHCANYTVKGTAGEVWLLRPTVNRWATGCGPTMSY